MRWRDITDGNSVELGHPVVIHNGPPTYEEVASGDAAGYAYWHGNRVVTLIPPTGKMPSVPGRGWWAFPAEYLPRGMWPHNPRSYSPDRLINNIEPDALGFWFSPDESPD